MAIWLLLLTSVALGTLPASDLGPFFKSSTVNTYLSALALTNSSVLTKTPGSSFNYVTLNTNDHPDYTVPTVLFLGSMHGGFPLSTYTVLYYLDLFLNSYSTNYTVQYVVDHSNLVFAPIVNTAAYSKMEMLYNSTGNFTPIWTGLEGSSWNCSNNSFAGINPDFDFSVNFVAGNDKCAGSGYTGSASLVSTISAEIAAFYGGSNPPAVVFYFDNQGDMIFIPTAASSQNLSDNQQNYYKKVLYTLVSQYTYEPYSNYSQKNGSLLDYANNQGSLIFEVWGDNQTTVTNSTVSASSASLWEFILTAIQYHNIELVVSPGTLYDFDCDSDCGNNYTKILTFALTIAESSYSPYYGDIAILPNFTSPNVTFLNITGANLLVNGTQTARVMNECTQTGQNVSCSSVIIPGFTTLKLNITYGVPDEISGDNNFVAVFTAALGKNPFDTITFTRDNVTENDVGSSSGGGSGPSKGVVTGLVLLIILLVLLLIAGIILCCAQKKKDLQNPPQFGSANVA